MPVESSFRTGEQFKQSRNDGRQVWAGGQKIANIATDPITRPVIEAIADWYDAHRDPAWRDELFDAEGRSRGLKIPLDGDDLWGLQQTIRAWAVRNAGHITHTPVEAHTIVLALRDVVHAGGNKDRIQAVDSYRDRMERTGLLATVPFAPAQTDRFRPPPERITPKVLRETEGGIIVSGALGLGTSIAYVDDVLCTPTSPPITTPERAVWFAFAVSSPGVKVVARKPALVTDDTFSYPLTARFDELDCTVVLDEVFVPWENVFAYRDPEFCNRYMFQLFDWATFHHLTRKLAHAEFLLGLALAVAKMQGLEDVPGVQNDISELIVATETMRTALRAAAADGQPRYTEAVLPGALHTLTGSIYAIEARARMGQTVRNLAGFGGLLSPALSELEDPELGPALQANYDGGGFSARQRAALLHLLNDATASALDGREAGFTAPATGGLPLWKQRVNFMWHKHNELAANVLALLPDWKDSHLDFAPAPPGLRAHGGGG